MRPIHEAWCFLIDITYYCGRGCIYCTRSDRHLGKRRYHMTLEEVEKAIVSYSPLAPIGLIGGEPQRHPEFNEICKLVQMHHPTPFALFTSIVPTDKERIKLISDTFWFVPLHEHSELQEMQFTHQPMTIAIKDAVRDEKLREMLIDDCWLQRKWCPTITKDGAFFCETGASIARMMGMKGWDVEPGWWMRTPEMFGYQKEVCQYCGMAIPMKRQLMADKVEKISPSVLELMKKNRLPLGKYEIFDREITVDEMKEALPTWTPGLYKKEQMSEQFQWSTLNWNEIT